VFKRGNAANVGDAVPRAFLAVLSPEPRPAFKQGSGRLELAKDIASKDNPLTARVIVNRVWGHHFGQAIVRTPSDFGRRGDPPTHPELLDYLAVRFMDEGWSLKRLHKEIMLSAVYQQASEDVDDKARLADPENLLLWRFNRQRLDFEATRDALLAVSGQIDLSVGGKSVDLQSQPFTHRRTIYGFIDRQNLPNLFRTFDFASPDSTSPQRFHTTVPQQALYMMNSPFAIDTAKAVMRREEIASEADPQKKIERLYEAVFDREPTPGEVQLGLAFVSGNDGLKSAQAAAKTPVWQYGYGAYDEELENVKAFHALPFFTGKVWQGGPAIPDAVIGYAMLTPTGGHPGNDQQHAVIRRWTALRDGTVSIAAKLEHSQKEGDGVRARIVSSRDGLLGTWMAKATTVETNVDQVTVKAGDTLDFIVDCVGGPGFDSFNWAPVISMTGTTWNATAEFSNDVSPKPDRSMNAWERYAQVLLETNEFVFVD
jgi:hypothetical protein